MEKKIKTFICDVELFCYVQNVLCRCINTLGLGGGTIKRQSACALLLVVTMAMCIFPSVGGVEDQNASDNSAKIGLNKDIQPLEVNAASKYKKYKKTKKYKKVKKYKKAKTYKNAKKYKYKRVKVRYKSRGKWKTKWVYKKVNAASSYETSYYRTSSAGWTSNPQLDTIMRSGAKYGYRRGISTAAAMQRAGAGDCWAMSEYLNGKLKSAGYNSRIVQYATSYSSKHRSVQVYQNGKWVTVPYRAYGYNSMFV
ncbi:MAG: hypothetical protein QMD61_05470 [Methanobacterium sp.]|nr:hypothetical protein [Methanobacterium sp.]